MGIERTSQHVKHHPLRYFYRFGYYLYLLKGDPMHGHWDEDTRNDRCILRCAAGYEPSGCPVIRYSHREGGWNHDIPSCKKGKDMSKFHVNTPPPHHHHHPNNLIPCGSSSTNSPMLYCSQN